MAAFTWRDDALLRATKGPSVLDTGCFPLVPFSNRIARGEFDWHGRRIDIVPNCPDIDPVNPLHGFGWLAAWDIVESGSARAVLEHRYVAGEWPWSYRARQTLVLDRGGLTVELSIENRSDRVMPAGLGFHPYFPRNEATIYLGRHRGEWRNDAQCLPQALRQMPDAIDWWHGSPVSSRTVDTVYTDRRGRIQIQWPDRNLQLSVSPSANLPFTVVYTPAGADYFCVEPVSHATNAFAGLDWPHRIHALSAGEILTASLTLGASRVS